jgi:DNA polymerase-3 subunit epsilon
MGNERRPTLINCFIDVETGGLEPGTCALLQIAGIIEYTKDGKRLDESFNFHIKPFDADQCNPKALAVNNLTKEQINGFESPSTVHDKLLLLWEKFVDKYDKRDKMFFIGYNSHSFDMPFVREFFRKCGDKYFGSWFHYPSIDVMILAAEHLKENRRWFPDFKLMTVADRLGIKCDSSKFHDALYDIEITREIYRKVAQK